MHAETVTDRLILTPISPENQDMVASIYSVQSDPETWRHLPDGKETDPAQTRALAADNGRSWQNHGLGWWAIRARYAFDGVAAGEFIGLGGASMRRPEIVAWNLGYRLRPQAWGQGFAAEVGAAALAAARAARADIPVTARALTRNPASWRTLDRIGLVLIWEGAARADDALTSGIPRRIYSDRELDPELREQLIRLG